METVELVRQFYGKTDLDINSPKLSKPWVGNVWLDLSNGQNSKSRIDRALKEYKETPTCNQVLLLVPSATHEEWFYELSRFPVVFSRGSPQALFYLGTRYVPFYRIFLAGNFYRC